MASAKRDIRSIIDSFSDDLILIAQDIAREQVQRAVLEWQAKNEKLLAKKSIQDEKAQRLEERRARTKWLSSASNASPKSDAPVKSRRPLNAPSGSNNG